MMPTRLPASKSRCCSSKTSAPTRTCWAQEREEQRASSREQRVPPLAGSGERRAKSGERRRESEKQGDKKLRKATADRERRTTMFLPASRISRLTSAVIPLRGTTTDENAKLLSSQLSVRSNLPYNPLLNNKEGMFKR